MSILQLVPLWFTLAMLIPIAVAVGRAYRKAKSGQTVICPENSGSALILLDARHAALMHIAGDSVRRIQSCSRWPEHRGCSLACLAGH
jgi:hypothetical protein